MGEPDGLPSMGSHRVGHDWSDLAAAVAAKNESMLNTGIYFFQLGNKVDLEKERHVSIQEAES